ncbi:MAG TPA: NAD-dependent epimerase/dehydratase family protein [Solirubrobacterales bacterium]|nr:NAD-dependent epimerase/dehydratase family protein [Solirubrobacterales bacterium]
MKALVTGGAGFIGSNLVDALLETGADVLVVDDLSTGRRTNLDGAAARGAELAECDIADRPRLEDAIDGFVPDRIFHLAAQADVRKAVADPAFDATVNVLGTINVLETARSHGAPVVFASTGGAIYGEGAGRQLPFPEEAPSLPETAYGASKFAGEVYLGLYRRLHGLAGVALRFGNVYGPRQDPHGEAGVVAIFCGLLREGDPLRVFGDGEQTRDYVYVADVVAAILAAERLLGREGAAVAGPYNIGTGVETSVLDLARRLKAATGADPEIEHHPARAGEVERVAIDPSAARRDLEWRAATELDDGLARTASALDDAA